MPKAAHHDTIARLFELLKLLPAKGPGITAKELCDKLENRGFSVSKRTIERDLTELSRLFGLECNDKGTPYGWHWMTGKGVELPGLTVADALSLEIVESLLRPLLPHALVESLEVKFTEARLKLAALAENNPNARWAEKVCHVAPTQPLLPPALFPDVLSRLQDSLLHDRQVDVEYQRPATKDTISLRLHPLGLVQRGSVAYLVASAFDYEDVRLYAVHRVKEATGTTEPVKRPAGFSLKAYVNEGRLQFGDGVRFKLEAVISAELAALLEETPLAEDQRLKPQAERVKLTATVLDSWQLVWWILSHGASIEVLKPVKLRKRIASTLQEAVAQYAQES